MTRTPIEWVARGEMRGYTWNPLGWGCHGGCEYCYARRFAHRGLTKCLKCRAFIPHWHPERMIDPLRVRKPSRVFVQSMGDLFGPWNLAVWILAVLSRVREASRHEFLLLTKHPEIMRRYPIPPNAWAGVTVTNQPDAEARVPILQEMVHSSRPGLRRVYKLSPDGSTRGLRFISVEPMLSAVDMSPWLNPGCYSGIDWVIIGAQTGPGADHSGLAERVIDLTDQCRRAGVPVFHKNSLAHVLPAPGWMHKELG